MGAGGAPATGLMQLRGPDPAAVARAQAAASVAANRLPTAQQPPGSATPRGGKDVRNAKEMVVPTRLGLERPPELARDGLARRPREEVGLHGHLGAKSLPGRSRG